MPMPGPKSTNIEDLKFEIDKLLNETKYFKTERENRRKVWYGDTKDGGCDKICGLLFDNDGHLLDTVQRHNSELINLKIKNEKMKKKIINDKYKIRKQNERIEYLENLEQELARIKFSRSYKIIQKINSIRKKVTRK